MGEILSINQLINQSIRWMFIRIELIGGFIMFCTAAFAVFYAHNGTIPVAMLGLTLSYALNVRILQF